MEDVRDLQTKLDEVQQDIINIESQLEHGDQAKSKGLKWAINAKTALRHKKREFQTLQHRIGLANREQRRANAVEYGHLFVHAAREMLSAEQFEAIQEKVRLMQSIAQPTTV